MPIRLLCVLLCLASAACATHAERCQGSLQRINTEPQPKATTAPAADAHSDP